MEKSFNKCPEISWKIAFRSISLIVNFSELLNSIVVLKIQENEFSIEITAYGNRENSYDSGFPIINKDGVLIFLENGIKLPKVINGKVLSIIGQFSYLQTAFLKICIESHRGIQMLESNPNLLWLILDYSIDQCFLTEDIYILLGKKRKKIIEVILGRTPLGSEKFISKILYLNGDKNELDLTKRALINDDVLHDYAHWENIPIQALYIGERYENLSGAGYLFDICQKPFSRVSEYLAGIPKLSKMTDDTIRMGISLNIKNSRKIVKSCSSYTQFLELHDKWIELLNKSQIYHDPDIKFDKPKIMECAGIVWISSANALIREGIEMEHCIATYVKKVENGDSIVFSVTKPERATLELRERNGEYELVEIKLKRNCEVSEETRLWVHEWLRKENSRLTSNTS